MKHKIKRWWIVFISGLVLSCAFLADVGISQGTFQALFGVPSDFLESIFSGILTFSTLSLTVLSMIIGMMDTKMSGLKLREILALDASPIKFSTYLWYSAGLSLLSIVALAFNLYTLMTAIAVCTLLYTTYTSVNVFKLVSDVRMCLKVILEEYESRGNQFINKFVYRWLDEYEYALHSNRLSELYHYAGLLQKCTTDQSSYAPIQKRLSNLLNVASANMSFAEAISWVFDKTGFSVQAESICENYIRSIQFFSADELLRFDIPGKIQSLIDNGLSSHHARARNLSYFLLAKLIDNEKAENTTKLEILDSCLRIITDFPLVQEINDTDTSAEDMDRMKHKVMNVSLKNTSQIKMGIILRVFLEKVLLDDNSIGDVIYEKLIEYLYIGGACRTNSIRINTIACMYECCYLLGYISDQIDPDKKKRIIGMATRHNPCLWDMVSYYITDVINYYIDREFNRDYVRNIVLAGAISPIDSVHFKNNEMGFAYALYLASPIALFSRDMDGLPLERIPGYMKSFKDYKFPLLHYLDKMDNNLQRVCNDFLKMFNSNTGMITEECMQKILDLQKMNGERILGLEFIEMFKERMIDAVFQAVHEAMQDAAQECFT